MTLLDTDIAPDNKLIFGVPASQVTSTTRAAWSQRDTAIFRSFAQGIWQSGITGSFANLPPTLELIDLVRSLGLIQFWDLHNVQGERLGPILKKKVVRKLENVWSNDLPALLQAFSAAANSSEEPDELAQQPATIAIGSIKKPFGTTTTRSRHRRHRSSTHHRVGLRLATMLKPAPFAGFGRNSGNDLIFRLLKLDISDSRVQLAAQRSIKRKNIPLIQDAPTPEELARKRGRTILKNHAITATESASSKKVDDNDDDDDDFEDDHLAEIKKDLDKRWNRYKYME